MVEIPDDVAKMMAAAWRAYAEGDVIQTGSEVRAWADLLDPKPPSLREQVYEVLISAPRGAQERADAVLAVVADAPIEQLIALVGPRFADWLAARAEGAES